MVPTSRPECDELRSLLPELLEEELKGSLPAVERERLLSHAGACSECAELLRSYRSLLTGLSALPRVPAPVGERGSGAGGHSGPSLRGGQGRLCQGRSGRGLSGPEALVRGSRGS